MRCTSCKSILMNSAVVCNRCGKEVQIVPDYNPLDEITRPIDIGNVNRRRYTNPHDSGNSTRIINQEDIDKIRAERREARSRNRRPQDSSLEKGHVGHENKKKKRGVSKKRAKRIMRILFILLAFALVAAFFINRNSYQGLVNRGNQALASGQLLQAETLFRRAIDRIPHRAEAYIGLSRIYIQNDRIDEAEVLFLNALDGQGTNVPLFKATIDFYIETYQLAKISILLDGAAESVILALEEYVALPPVLSLDDGYFDEVQEVALQSDTEGTIFYTTDGSEPHVGSQRYTEPILLTEGSHIIRAILVNDLGIPSLTVTGTFSIELPSATAPLVTPMTGQYHVATPIVVQVPEGYTAHYTLDGSIPTSQSPVYEGPIEMLPGRTIFSVILINDLTGRETDVTVRNYVLN